MVPRILPYIQSVEKGLRAGWERVREGIESEKENGNRLSPCGADTQLSTQMVINTFN